MGTHRATVRTKTAHRMWYVPFQHHRTSRGARIGAQVTQLPAVSGAVVLFFSDPTFGVIHITA